MVFLGCESGTTCERGECIPTGLKVTKITYDEKKNGAVSRFCAFLIFLFSNFIVAS